MRSVKTFVFLLLISSLSYSLVSAEPKVKKSLSDGSFLVFIPSGSFVIGSNNGDGDERPKRQIYVNSFWIDQHELSVGKFARFVIQTRHQTTAERKGWSWVWDSSLKKGKGWWRKEKGVNWKKPQGISSDWKKMPDQPVSHVTWFDADSYCKWAGRELPTEAQWERAARGDEERMFPWGNERNAKNANLKGTKDGFDGVSPVGSFPQGASVFGVLDMSGNVWEWVSDWYASTHYQKMKLKNPSGPLKGKKKVIRGASWGSKLLWSRVSNRYSRNRNYRNNKIGFRCVLNKVNWSDSKSIF
ncbi:MAG: formylglycine-generating enzyme family protein [Nitrospinota bacterium]|nr:formylglycine-generating enzyme family protein [Nitrospinota bacterium]